MTAQRAAIAVKMLGPLKEEAKKRQVANLRRGDEVPVPPELGEREVLTGEAVEQAGRIVGVGKTTIQYAKAVSEARE